MTTDSAAAPFGDRAAFRARQQAWERFHDWEDQVPKGPTDLPAVWRWYTEMYELGISTGAILAHPGLDLAKIEHLQRVHARLAQMRWPS